MKFSTEILIKNIIADILFYSVLITLWVKYYLAGLFDFDYLSLDIFALCLQLLVSGVVLFLSFDRYRIYLEIKGRENETSR